jgi:hypothetical protein
LRAQFFGQVSDLKLGHDIAVLLMEPAKEK